MIYLIFAQIPHCGFCNKTNLIVFLGISYSFSGGYMIKRGSGVLLHITSLPSAFGIGDMGPQAYRFADFLARTKQSYWQVLPLIPTNHVFGNSPYSSFSAFAGNILLISPELLVKDGFLNKSDIESVPDFPKNRCDYDTVTPYKYGILSKAFDNFKKSKSEYHKFEEFCETHKHWLDHFAMFAVAKHKFNGAVWSDWPDELKNQDPVYIESFKKDCRPDMEKEKFFQYIFFKQWHSLKKYCNDMCIHIIGDIPIYVNYDSADAWENSHIFKLDERKKPICVAGVPPDYFSSTGQLWGNPLYRWDVMRQNGYKWWIERIAHNLDLYDIVRIDHFRGLVAFWEVKYGEPTAINGKWVDVPVHDFMDKLVRRFYNLPIIAEDLGTITPDVKEIMHKYNLPGMKVLLFAFGADDAHHPYLPHNYERNFAVYTGTHDNNTVKGWFENEADHKTKERLFRYIGRETPADDIHWEFIRIAMKSVADMSIIPLQDILGLGEESRMNRPSVGNSNWEWRFESAQLTGWITDKLRSLTETFGRI